ncbi:hypothetical protein ANO14919_104640 [Xylariales sp. No.14919]|nr:hypothetical protein ANO14919_104640 [Xylariales sp. No.14919]
MWPYHIEEDTRHRRTLNNHRASPEDGACLAFSLSMFEGPELDHTLVPLYGYTQGYPFTNTVAYNLQPSFQDDGFPSNLPFDNGPATNRVPEPQWDSVTGPPLPSFPAVPSLNQVRPHSCNTCPTAFKHRKDLNRHMDTVHATGQELVYRCSCGKTDIRKDNHRRHVGTCTKKRSDCPYICKCLSRYKDEEEYLSHISSCLAVAPARK